MITSEQRLRQIRNAAGATGIVIGLVELLLIGLELASLYFSNGEGDYAEYYTGFKTFFSILAALMLVAFILFLSIDIYMRLERRGYKRLPSFSESPLQGLTKEQEELIIATLKTVAKPLPGKAKLNRARTAQFLRALTELGYIDPHLDGKIIMPWIEHVTGYIDGEPGHFNDQYRKASIVDENVKKHMEEIKQLLAL